MQQQLSMIDVLNSSKDNINNKSETLYYLTLNEVAKLLGVTWQTVRNYIKQNKLKAIMLNEGRNYRISPNDLCEFILNRNTKKETEINNNINMQMDNIYYNKNTKNCVLYYENKASISQIFENIKDIKLDLIEKNNQYKYLDSIFWGDNLLVLNKLLTDLKGRIDLIYIDPRLEQTKIL